MLSSTDVMHAVAAHPFANLSVRSSFLHHGRFELVFGPMFTPATARSSLRRAYGHDE